MADFNVRSDSVNVEQIMEQIRARIREKRGVDYTEEQIRELAAVKLEKFLDPRGVRSDLFEQFKKRQPRVEPPNVPSFTFEDTTMFETHRGGLRFIRKLLAPVLKLLFNPNPLIQALHVQAEINKATLQREAERDHQRRDVDGLYFEVIHNLVVEVTRTGIEMKNLKMQVESLASRLEFNERRARALESAVVYQPARDEPVLRTPEPQPATAPVPYSRPSAQPANPSSSVGAGPAPGQGPAPGSSPAPGGQGPEGPGQRSRRRRRRRGRRGGPPAAGVIGAPVGGDSGGSSTPVADPSTGGRDDSGESRPSERSGEDARPGGFDPDSQ